MILNETGINVDQTEKKNMLFFQPNYHFFFGKKCGFVHRKISDEKVKKNEVQKNALFAPEVFRDS